MKGAGERVQIRYVFLAFLPHGRETTEQRKMESLKRGHPVRYESWLRRASTKPLLARGGMLLNARSIRARLLEHWITGLKNRVHAV